MKEIESKIHIALRWAGAILGSSASAMKWICKSIAHEIDSSRAHSLLVVMSNGVAPQLLTKKFLKILQLL